RVKEKNIPERQNPTVKGIGHYMATVKCCLKPKNKRFEHEDKYKGCPIQVRNHNPQYCLRCKSNGDNDGILSALIPGRVFLCTDRICISI
ncbi:hypothetical protein QHY38_004766, partial [Klebsiella pneumoniae]